MLIDVSSLPAGAAAFDDEDFTEVVCTDCILPLLKLAAVASTAEVTAHSQLASVKKTAASCGSDLPNHEAPSLSI
jgi:hypothetical protein